MAIWCRTAEDYLLDLIELRKGTSWEPEAMKELRGTGGSTQDGDEDLHGYIAEKDARERGNDGQAYQVGQKSEENQGLANKVEVLSESRMDGGATA